VRAVPLDALRQVRERVGETTPIHVHVSEQAAENRDCLEATGMTPTGLLDEAGLLGSMTTLVHATHLSEADIAAIGGSNSGVCYCATTERDLADGLGPALELVDAGAALSVGSDSHAVIDLFEEARGVEMHQRLRTGRRGLMGPATLLAAATTGGSASLGLPAQGLADGAAADFIVIDPTSPRLAGMDVSSLDAVVFAATAADVTDTFVAGRRVVAGGLHPLWEEVREALSPASN
jgi:formiminoglutamate deiminase